jgi:hypothetical protein
MTKKEKENYQLIKDCVVWAWENDCEVFNYYSDGDLIISEINCNDLFWWGCADSEVISKDNFYLLEEARKDLLSVDANDKFVYSGDVAILFACKSRKMRPQTPYYRSINKKYWHLFDACGEVRKDQLDRDEYLKIKENHRNNFGMMWFWFKKATVEYIKVLRNLRKYRI